MEKTYTQAEVDKLIAETQERMAVMRDNDKLTACMASINTLDAMAKTIEGMRNKMKAYLFDIARKDFDAL